MRVWVLLLLVCVSYVWSRGQNIIPIPRANPTIFNYPLEPGSQQQAAQPLTGNFPQTTTSSNRPCGNRNGNNLPAFRGPVRDILFAGESYNSAFFKFDGSGVNEYQLIYDNVNETTNNFSQHVLGLNIQITVADQKYQVVPLDIPPLLFCRACVLCTWHVDPSNTNSFGTTCADVMIVDRALTSAIRMSAQAPNPDYEPMVAENIARAILVQLALDETVGVHIARWPVVSDDPISGIRTMTFEFRFSPVPGLYPDGNTTSQVFLTNLAYVTNTFNLNGFTALSFTGLVAPTAGPEQTPENLVVNTQNTRVLKATIGNVIAGSIFLSFFAVGAIYLFYVTKDRAHKAFTSASKGFTYVQLAGGVTFLNALSATLAIVAITSQYWAQTQHEHMGIFEKCADGAVYAAGCYAITDNRQGFYTNQNKSPNWFGVLQACKAFMIMAVIPLVCLFIWSLSSLFTKNFLKMGLQLAYGGAFASLCCALSIGLFGAYFNDVVAPFATFRGEQAKVGTGFWIAFTMMFVSILAFGMSLALAAKEGDGTTQASVTRNWGDAPFASKPAESTVTKARAPSVPERPNPNRGAAPAVAPRPSGWFNKAAAKPKLAPGWSEVKSKDGDAYYWNESTGESTWDAPLAASSPPPRPAPPSSSSASGSAPPRPAPLQRAGSGRGNTAAMEI